MLCIYQQPYATVHTVYASQTDNACSRLFAAPSLWTVTHQLNLSPLPFPCAPSHLPSSSLPNKGVTKMTKDSPQNEMQHQAEKNTRIQFHPKTNILWSIALYRFYLLVFHQFGDSKHQRARTTKYKKYETWGEWGWVVGKVGVRRVKRVEGMKWKVVGIVGLEARWFTAADNTA